MKIELKDQPYAPRRGIEPAIGNVYQNPHGRPFYKIIVGIKSKECRAPWNNIVMIHINSKGEVIGASTSPELYVKDHHDYVGKIVEMPILKIEWIGAK